MQDYPRLNTTEFDVPSEWNSNHKMLLENIFKYVKAAGYKTFDFTSEIFNQLKDAQWTKFMFNLDEYLHFNGKKA